MATNKQSRRASPAAPSEAPIPGQLWQVPTFFLGVLAILAVWISRPLWYDSDLRMVQQSLREARRTLDDRQAPVNELPALLDDALGRINRVPARAGEAHFLLGWTYTRLTAPAADARTTELWTKARQHLELADKLGVAEADRTRLQYLLGKAWFQTGGDPERIVAYLSQSIDQVPDDRGDGYAMLAQCYLRLPTPNLPGALEANQKQLDRPTADENLLAPARLLRGELLLRVGDRQGARKVLARIGAGAPTAVVSAARRLQARSYQDEEAWAEAAQLWETILADRREVPPDLPSLLFSLGWCYRNLHRAEDAARAWERAISHAGEEGQAARLRLAELWLESNRRNQGVELLAQALGPIAAPEDYHLKSVNLAQATGILATGCHACQEAGDFVNAQKLAQLMTKLVAADQGQALVARVTEAWALSLTERARKQKSAAAAQVDEAAARVQFQEAARAYEAAAVAAANKPEALGWLWQAMLDYREAGAMKSVTLVLDRYLNLQPPPEKLSEAWYRLGEAHQALRNSGLAVLSFQQCIAAPLSPFAYRARYQLAMLALAEGQAKQAEDMLQHNLEQMRRDPDPEAHENSLWAMAVLLYQQGNYGMAAFYLDEQLKLYPTRARVNQARFMLAQCYYRMADSENRNSLKPGAPGLHSREQYQSLLEKAAANFQKLTDDLEARRLVGRLDDADSELLRSALFAIANCRFDQGSWDEAIRLYHNLERRYQHQVGELLALKQLWSCYLVLRPADIDKAKATLRRAEEVLKSLDDFAFKGWPESQNRPALEAWLKNAQATMASYDTPAKPM